MASGGRILLIDDDTSIRELLTVMLEEEGFEIRGVGSGRAGLALLPDWPPDLVMLDLHMADLDGAGFLGACRQNGHPPFQVLVMSAVPDLRIEAARLGVSHTISKPFELDDMVETVKQVLAD